MSADERTMRLEALRGEIIAEERRAAAARAAREAAAASPEAEELALRIKVDAARTAREIEERRTAGEAAWMTAQAAHGDRVDRVDTDEGDVIVMLAMTSAEVDASEARAERLQRAAVHACIRAAKDERPSIEAMASAEARGAAEATEARRDAVLAKIVHPTVERMRILLARKPLVWAQLYIARDRMISGERRDEGKGFAPS